jgi:hypothetical protein
MGRRYAAAKISRPIKRFRRTIGIRLQGDSNKSLRGRAQ